MLSLSLFNFLGRVPRKKLFKNEVTMLMLARQLTRWKGAKGKGLQHFSEGRVVLTDQC